MNHVMLDIETLDTSPSAVVASIAAVVFRPGKGSGPSRFYALDDWQRQLNRGRTVGAETLRWWFKQSPEAISEGLLGGGEGHVIATGTESALKDLSDFLRISEVEHVWGNGAAFDNVILKSLARTFGIDHLWSYRYDRCFRTLTSIYDPDKQFRPRIVGTHHNPLDDCYSQIDWLNAIIDNHANVDAAHGVPMQLNLSFGE